MADMPTSLWGGWIAAVTVVSLVALAWLVISAYFSKPSAAELRELDEQIWDHTLREGSHPAPLWWFWFILALMVVSVVYLTLYPGLGAYRGALGWSQASRFADSVERYETLLGPQREQLQQADFATLQSDAAAMRSARHIYMNHCAACHGPDARGQANLFPGLTHGIWQWGGSAVELERTIRNGRQGIMPPLGSVFSTEDFEALLDFVAVLSANEADGVDSGPIAQGRRVYQSYCSACHSPDGSGMALLGAPALNNDIWTYGGTRNAIRESVTAGRSGRMPGFDDALDDLQIRLLVAWLMRGARE